MKKRKALIAILLSVSLLVPLTSSSQNQMFNMTYVYFGSLSSYVSQVDQTNRTLNVVAPSYFDIKPDGTLDVTWRLQSRFIDAMHTRGIKVVPFLANHWNTTAGKNGLANREQLARDIAAAIEKYNLDGVNVDIEGLNQNYKDEHTDFIRRLREYIPNHKEVSVAVAANPNNWKTGWHGFYDYKALSDYADYLMIMAYDESWESPESPIVPVSSISFFERSVQYAIDQGVPRDKIVVGLPFYGRMWKMDGPTTEGKVLTGFGISINRIEPLVAKYNGGIQYDERTQSAKATFTIPKGESTFVGNTKLTEGDYLIWYDNEAAIKAKLQVPSKYGIKGTGSWALSMEPKETWSYYASTLNNNRYFTDVVSDNWAAKSINFVSQKGWMQGTSISRFSPGHHITRAQAAVVIVRALNNTDYEPSAFQFKDLNGHWAQKEIEIARELGYVEGFSPEKFNPDSYLTRAQLAQMLYNIFEFPISDTNNPFPDLKKDHWAYDSILSLSKNGFIEGYKDGTFKPALTSTRAQMAALMERMAEKFDQRASK
ncbi:glycosyl hydrolase family 18 protein [Bacillaceae bacterium W0354]